MRRDFASIASGTDAYEGAFESGVLNDENGVGGREGCSKKYVLLISLDLIVYIDNYLPSSSILRAYSVLTCQDPCYVRDMCSSSGTRTRR